MDKFSILNASLTGELFWDNTMRMLYATDASIYRELPAAVAYPKNKEDILQLIHFAKAHQLSLIPRAAGTSLAGQCVGNGIVVDMSKYFTRILHFDKEKQCVTVETGVIRDELNRFLKPHQAFFGPNTSTANRAMIGGMVGNNSCGSYSIVYGNTRDNLLAVKGFLSDGTEVVFEEMSVRAWEEKCKGDSLEAKIYRQLKEVLFDVAHQAEIKKQFPKPSIRRRNTGYALDELLESIEKEGKINLAKLVCGAEGTLMICTEMTLKLHPLPPKEEVMVCAHFASLKESLESVTIAMQFQPRAVELMDKIVLDCTKENIEHRKNRFFLTGDPAAILMVEFGADTKEAVITLADAFVAAMQRQGKGYAFPYLFPPDNHKANELRKAGLGLLSNIPGDAKAVAVIEDTAVDVNDLTEYILEFDGLMRKYEQTPVYYAHAGAGELHIRPVLNLRTPEGLENLRKIAYESANLVKKYQGSLSGEHGDGRVRGEFIPLMMGEKMYALFCEVKKVWDEDNIFNVGKITAAPPMDTALRDRALTNIPNIPTLLDFSREKGFLRAVEKCNGSGDCRKLATSGGTMCPSYMATQNEKDSTRARANILREMINQSYQNETSPPNPFHHLEIFEVMDLCLSCKGCKSECPSNVDMAMLKAEFLHQYYEKMGVPFAVKAMANIDKLNAWAAFSPKIANFFLQNTWFSGKMKKVLGVAPQRTLPTLSPNTFRKSYENYAQPANLTKTVYLFADEFTQYNEANLGIKTIQLLNHLGYKVVIPKHKSSGRAYFSKGLLGEAKQLANENIRLLKEIVSVETPLLGIEPSAILMFRDEYLRLAEENLQEDAKKLAQNTLLVEAFLAREMKKGAFSKEVFSKETKNIALHLHCHQKTLANTEATVEMLSFPENYQVAKIPSGCCGMAGSFGYEAEHYDVSMKIGNLVLFPYINATPKGTIIAASGTSCRHQILDGTQTKALHPIEILWKAAFHL